MAVARTTNLMADAAIPRRGSAVFAKSVVWSRIALEPQFTPHLTDVAGAT